ncbi:Alpha-D-ribose 1-methylphosphonate 5-triphosphate synthase subunit PhnI [Paraburkholderia aspalathi]|uniref:Alpha-D-ribose 1-methylphosphonate 5-triphosphate synthase subunit PhnI n=1 Tax=Paraburkholderia aspalathi TaxID=1324617 RepID=A0ABM8SV55_9BURK|nr:MULTISPECIES: carbon-phosphorus lyase complex subunit PhnI [Paraburkholderia]MCP2088464.1 alpha-D-ribose 1-methylphosphonate 5-triphosphate synthase subunit PhnI [Paraburkholderia sediminicola]MBK3822743.1 carbon-phosphorus lyase complex subunit PhnI [Paraburkholderia aspalathi]MBK3834576.1 carbon-phosphorus lyase complex subunit PhnI [Paraburkholderia aspalathi]MBK3864310.1 carbon-phosphorus lyase complex subunit PhnI [Paraburkholderia aspalathi]MCX4141849.1 carbon-phosphorus lyase complex
MYVAVKGGERAIEASWRLLDKSRRGDTRLAELSVAQIREQLRLAVARVMTEGSVYDEELAALAIKQAAGDLVEAIFLLRAYRTTLPRFGYTQAIDTEAMQVERRISATFKDVPGGQMLGATYDYTQRLLDFALLAEGDAGNDLATTPASIQAAQSAVEAMPRVVTLLDKEGLIEQERPTPDAPEPGDLSREPLAFPASRATRLQNLARGDEGFLLAMGYATQRGYAHTHPFAGEIRFGTIAVEMELDELGEAVEIGDIDVTECQMINQFAGSSEVPPTFTQGYGLAFGHSERKAMAMALVDRALRAEELGETLASPTQDIEFMLSHSDNVEASGFVQHLKLPHYVDFQSELELVRRLRAQHSADGQDLRKDHDQQEQAA